MKKGFTLAEVLITLSIIGIIAVIVLPSLIANVKDKAWDVQKKALLTRLTLAITGMDNLGNYGKFKTSENEGGEKTTTEENAAQAFIVDGLSKYYKIESVCTYSNTKKLTECGIADSYKYADSVLEAPFPSTFGEYFNDESSNGEILGTKNSVQGAFYGGSKPVGFTTSNGESIAAFYNPYCGESNQTNWGKYLVNGINYKKSVCAIFLYDLNGIKAPNQFGLDMGMITVFYKTDPVVVGPIPLLKGTTWVGKDVQLPLLSDDDDMTGQCAESGGRVPTAEEGIALMANGYYTQMSTNYAWTSTMYNESQAYRTYDGTLAVADTDTKTKAYCIKK